jgi:predicted DNA-binding transcriptional regulator AlpA
MVSFSKNDLVRMIGPNTTLPNSLPPRGICRKQAAEYLGVSPSHFDKLVNERIIPPAKRLGGRAVWDVRQLDKAFDELDSGAWDNDNTNDQNGWDRSLASKT